MGGIHEVRRSDGPRCHDKHTKFHIHSGIQKLMGDIQTGKRLHKLILGSRLKRGHIFYVKPYASRLVRNNYFTSPTFSLLSEDRARLRHCIYFNLMQRYKLFLWLIIHHAMKMSDGVEVQL